MDTRSLYRHTIPDVPGVRAESAGAAAAALARRLYGAGARVESFMFSTCIFVPSPYGGAPHRRKAWLVVAAGRDGRMAEFGLSEEPSLAKDTAADWKRWTAGAGRPGERLPGRGQSKGHGMRMPRVPVGVEVFI